MLITNNSKAPQGVHDARGIVYIQPGRSREVELSTVGLTMARRLKFLSISEELESEEDPPETVDQVQVSDESVVPEPQMVDRTAAQSRRMRRKG